MADEGCGDVGLEGVGSFSGFSQSFKAIGLAFVVGGYGHRVPGGHDAVTFGDALLFCFLFRAIFLVEEGERNSVGLVKEKRVSFELVACITQIYIYLS